MRTFDHKLSTTFLISTVYPLGPAAIILMPLLVGGVVDDFGFTEQQAGIIAALEGTGLVLAALVAALWVRKLSWTTMLAVGFITTALLNVVAANLDTFIPFLVVRFLAGFTAGSIFALTVTALGDNKHPDRAFGIAQVMQGALMFCAFSAGGYILQRWSVSGLYYMLAVASMLMSLTLWRYPAEGAQKIAPDESRENVPNYTALIWIGLLASFLFFCNIFGFWTYIERIGQSAGLSIETIGLALGASQFAAIAGAGAAAIASDRYGRVTPLALVLAGQMLVLWLLVGQFTEISFYVGVGLFQALFMVGNAYQLGVISRIDIKGNFMVLITGFQGMGAAAGPAIAGSLIDNGDYSGINQMAALCLLVSISMFFFIIYRSRHVGVIVVDDEGAAPAKG